MARPSNELHMVRRTFILLIILVVLPSAGLSAFGILAIKNEQASETLRIDRVMDDIEARLTQALASTLDAVPDMRSADAEDAEAWLAELRGGNTAYGRSFLYDGRSGAYVLDEFTRGGDAFTQEARQAILGRAQELTKKGSGYFQAQDPPPTGINLFAARVLRDGELFVYQHDEATLSSYAGKLAKSDLPISFVLRRVAGPPKDERIFTMLAEMVGSRQAQEARPIVTRHLAPPLSDFELVSLPTEESEASHLRIRVVYILLMVFFYIALAVGTALVIHDLFQGVRLSRLKTDFLSAVSHDLKTPMTSIRLFVETLAMGRATEEESRECIQMLLRETERLSRMIERVLDFSRIESGRKIYRMRSVPPMALVESALMAFRTHGKASGKGFDEELLHIRPGHSVPDVLADPEAISGVILNLLENAVKYAGTDKPVTIAFERQPKGGVVFSVADQGPGISKSDQGRIFEQFYRADNLLSRKTEGSGLGLAIAKRVVKMHQGRIWLESAPGKGTTFFFTLPSAE